MARQKITLTLETDTIDELRERVGARSLSAAVERAVTTHLEHLRHLAAVDTWLAEMEREHGPVPQQTLDWAARLVDQWDAERRRRIRRAS